MENMIIRQATLPYVPRMVAPAPAVRTEVIPAVEIRPRVEPSRLPFIEANTEAVTVQHLQDDCIVPVFSKDNELTISHQSFIAAVEKAAQKIFHNEVITAPEVRVSHVIKGRTPEAIHKPVSQLEDSDRTIYYERMMFCLEIPSIHKDIAGNRLNLTVGGVRAYNRENLGTKKSLEKFSVFIGFKNLVCCNLCVSTDGYKADIKALNVDNLLQDVSNLFGSYDMNEHLRLMSSLQDIYLSESQFAQFLGRCRLYQYLPSSVKKGLPELLLTDTQVGSVAKAYYEDDHFGRGVETHISMWNVYNLLTGAVKSSYIDNFLDRSMNSGQLAWGLGQAVCGLGPYTWFLN